MVMAKPVAKSSALKRLKSAFWLKKDDVQRVLGLLDGAEGRTRVVGGIVRDTLLGRIDDRQEVDLATELLPDEVMRRAKDKGLAAYPTGIEHGTVTLKSGDTALEVTTLREDVETDGRHAVVKFGTDWSADAARRDFTMNALYLGADGELFDPLGGLEDCLARHVRFIGDADTRIAEDRLRVFRFFRFSASHGGEVLDPEGLAAAGRASGQLDALSAERVGVEMLRMLSLEKVARTLAAMAANGVLLLGEESLLYLAVYEHMAKKPMAAARLALIMLETGAEALRHNWRLSNAMMKDAADIAGAAGLVTAGRMSEAAYRYGGLTHYALPVTAVLDGWAAQKLRRAEKALAEIKVPDFPLRGQDLLAAGYAAGPELGAELARLERSWIESGFSLDREDLLADIAKRQVH